LNVEVRERHALEERVATLTEQSEADRHACFHDPLTVYRIGRCAMIG
jgi:hypothetical protein